MLCSPGKINVSEAWSRPAFLVAKEAHNEDMETEVDRFWTRNFGCVETFQVAHFLLRPYFHSSSVGRFVIAALEAVFARDIFVSVFEDENTGLVDLNRSVLRLWFRVFLSCWGQEDSSIDICFLARAQTSINLTDETPVYHL